MTDPVTDDTPEKPLDPAILRVQARMHRLMLIAGLTLGLGLVAVFAAIIYRVATLPDKAPAVAETPAPVTPPVPARPPAAAGNSATPAGEAAIAKAITTVKAVLPVRAWLVSAAISGDRIVLAYEHANGTTMFVIDATSLEITGRLDLKPE